MKIITTILILLVMASCSKEGSSELEFIKYSPETEESKSSEQDQETNQPSSEAEEESESNREESKSAFEIQVDFETAYSVLKDLFSSEALAADTPYCESQCNTDKCVYLFELNGNNETLICSRNKDSQSVSFVLHNQQLLVGKLFEIRTYDHLEKLSQETGDSIIFTISEDHIDSNKTRVVIKRQSLLSTILVKESLNDDETSDMSIEQAYKEFNNEEVLTTIYDQVILEENTRDQDLAVDNEDYTDFINDVFLPQRNNPYFRETLINLMANKDINNSYETQAMSAYIPHRYKEKIKLKKKKRNGNGNRR